MRMQWVGFALLTMSMTSPAQAFDVVSDFSSDLDGWLINGHDGPYYGLSSAYISHKTSGFNPFAQFNEPGPHSTELFYAPSKFTGDLSAIDAISFEIYTTYKDTGKFTTLAMLTSSTGVSIGYRIDLTSDITTGVWNSYTIPMDYTYWHIWDTSSATWEPATSADFTAVVSDAAEFEILADFRSHAGVYDISKLDNVVFENPFEASLGAYSCPGTGLGDLHIEGATPGGTVAVYWASGSTSGAGTVSTSASTCPGTVTELDAADIEFLNSFTVDSAGNLDTSPTIDAKYCGGEIQVIDGSTCELSGVVAVN